MFKALLLLKNVWFFPLSSWDSNCIFIKLVKIVSSLFVGVVHIISVNMYSNSFILSLAVFNLLKSGLYISRELHNSDFFFKYYMFYFIPLFFNLFFSYNAQGFL